MPRVGFLCDDGGLDKDDGGVWELVQSKGRDCQDPG